MPVVRRPVVAGSLDLVRQRFQDLSGFLPASRARLCPTISCWSFDTTETPSACFLRLVLGVPITLQNLRIIPFACTTSGLIQNPYFLAHVDCPTSYPLNTHEVIQNESSQNQHLLPHVDYPTSCSLTSHCTNPHNSLQKLHQTKTK
jgi:hypothetical protein